MRPVQLRVINSFQRKWCCLISLFWFLAFAIGLAGLLVAILYNPSVITEPSDNNFTCSDLSNCSLISTVNMIPPQHQDFTIIGGPGIGVIGGMHSLTIYANIMLKVPEEYQVEFQNGVMCFEKVNQPGNLVWASPANGTTGLPQFRMLSEADLPSNISVNVLYGTLSVTNGGTGSNIIYGGNQIIISAPDGQSLIEGGLIGGTGINISMIGNNFIFDVIGNNVIQVDISVPIDLFSVTSLPITSNGTLMFETNVQGANLVWAGPVNGGNAVPTFRLLTQQDIPLINLTTGISDILSIVNGGTGNGDPLLGNRVMLTNTNQQMIESGILNDGQIIIGQSGSIPLVGQITAPGGEIIVTNGPGTITLGLGESLSITDLTVTGDTFLGTNTSCLNPLQPSCYDISGQSCPSGALTSNCIPDDIMFNTVITNNLIVLNSTTLGTVVEQEFFNVTNLILDGPMMCSGNGTISQDCFSLSGKTCPSGMPLSESCIPASLVFIDLTSTGNLTVNNMVCSGGALPNPCIPNRVATINGIMPNGTTLDYIISTGTGISATPIANGILLSNTGVTSVGLSVPIDIFDVTVSPITTTGTLTFTTKTQSANTVWAGPISGSPAPPSFRTLHLDDLPGLPTDQLIVGTGTGVTNATLMAGNGISIVGLTISNTGVTSVGLSLPGLIYNVTVSPVTTSGTLTAELLNQTANTFFSGPISGGMAPPTWRSIQASDLSGLVLTSVGLNVPTAEFSIANSPLTADGTMIISKNNQLKNTFWAGPISGTNAQPTFRGLNILDMDTLGLMEGDLIMGGPGNVPIVGNLIAGAGVNITNEPGGGIRISAADVNGTSFGTVMSVGLSAPGLLFSVSGSPVTTMGTLGLNLLNQTANTVLMGPVSGSPTMPTFRLLQTNDLPVLNTDQIYIGVGGITSIRSLVAGQGISILTNTTSTVISTDISVGLSISGSLFTVTNSPVTTSGTLTATLNVQFANHFFAGPFSGSPDIPTFRSIQLDDLPALGNGQLYIGQGGTPVASGLSAGSGINIMPGMGTITISAVPGQANLGHYQLTGTTQISTQSNTYVLMTGMSLVPTAGTYLVTFSSSGSTDSASSEGVYAIFNDGVIIDHSERLVGAGGGAQANNFNVAFHTQAILTVNGAQTVQIQWKMGGTNKTLRSEARNLILLQITT